ncbi:molybdopterin-guanine dinucleotide biosynthesis protein B [Salipaludibacillus daqingensis]|uniref:molybdopterin-guanine dinucleotide biosynthesis protein B n=1 Tax=Salipaludibacillus daqingensis TaxID=3041001 RepID=UPI002473B2DF|nr:molybdopterin-guanine dinucleotide biosynthesis protein B [Salipaludibacillus daqingensis]
MIIHQVVGFSNSGKTTIVSALIESLTKRQLKVATIKHHGDNSPLVKEAEKKDTVKHRDAGALGTLVASDNELSWIVHHNQSFRLDDYIRMYEVISLDVLLIEGFKKEFYPKTVVIRSPKDEKLLRQTNDVKAIIYWEKELMLSLKEKYPLASFHIDELKQYSHWFNEQIDKGEF